MLRIYFGSTQLSKTLQDLIIAVEYIFLQERFKINKASIEWVRNKHRPFIWSDRPEVLNYSLFFYNRRGLARLQIFKHPQICSERNCQSRNFAKLPKFIIRRRA